MAPLKILGKFLISAGAGVLLFLAWTLWGTGIYTERQQNRLEREFAALAPAPAAETGSPGRNFDPAPGAPAFKLEIPAIDVERIIVEGVEAEQLKLGPGHYPACADQFALPLCFEDESEEYWPGEEGRVIVSGHRTTYGAPFWDLDKLEKGDRIRTITKWGTFVYVVTETSVVDDDELVAATGNSAELLLTTCNPKFSADQRYLVLAELEAS
ncbi:MAG: class E sortase [Actinobacteria bacterium]|nr:class E sortase [Actinomycetota bacterium]